MDAPPVQYVTTPDGVNIAYCVSGSGPTFVHMPFVFNHIQLYWRPTSVYRRWFESLAARFRLIQYDSRGMGMSSRGLRPELYSPEALLSDLATVIERLRLERCVVFGTAGPASLAIEYALRHPERIAAIVADAPVLALGPARPALSVDLATEDWDLFLSTHAAMGPEPSRERQNARLEDLREILTREDWLNLQAGVRPRFAAVSRETMIERLRALKVPTLIIHPRDFRIVNTEESQAAAAAIPGARLAIVDGHAMPGDVDQTLDVIDRFLGDLLTRSSEVESMQPPSVNLSGREVEVLRLIAAGRSNAQIADELVISQNTVIRHVSNIFGKIGAANRAEATSYAHRQGLV